MAPVPLPPPGTTGEALYMAEKAGGQLVGRREERGEEFYAVFPGGIECFVVKREIPRSVRAQHVRPEHPDHLPREQKTPLFLAGDKASGHLKSSVA